jgi:hypothetical protein
MAVADAEEIRVIYTIAHQIKADGKNQVAIGYEMFINPLTAKYNILNPIYRVGCRVRSCIKYDMASPTRSGVPKVSRPPTYTASSKQDLKSARRSPDILFDFPWTILCD